MFPEMSLLLITQLLHLRSELELSSTFLDFYGLKKVINFDGALLPLDLNESNTRSGLGWAKEL